MIKWTTRSGNDLRSKVGQQIGGRYGINGLGVALQDRLSTSDWASASCTDQGEAGPVVGRANMPCFVSHWLASHARVIRMIRTLQMIQLRFSRLDSG